MPPKKRFRDSQDFSRATHQDQNAVDKDLDLEECAEQESQPSDDYFNDLGGEDENVDHCLKLAEMLQEDSHQSAPIPSSPEEGSEDRAITNIDNHMKAWLLQHQEHAQMAWSSPLGKEEQDHNTTATSVNLDPYNLEVTAHSSSSQHNMICDTSLAYHEPDSLDISLGVSGTTEQTYSTPQKQTPLTVSFSQYILPSNDDKSDLSSVSSGDTNEEEDIETDLEEYIESLEHNSNVSISESVMYALLDQSNQEQEIQEQDSSNGEEEQNFSKAQLFNSLTIHDQSELSVNQGILHLMDLYINNRLSKQGFHRTVEVFCMVLPEGHRMPSSSHCILSYLESLAPPVPATTHFYCQDCLFYHGKENVGLCEICDVPTSFGRFFNFDIAALIKYFFESRDLASILDLNVENDSSDSTSVRSLKDGTVYKSLNTNRGKYDLNIIFGSDGVRIRKGSTKELWLSMFTIAEVPLHLQRFYLTIIGVWYDSKKPDMKTFLRPFAEQMATLDQSGVEWTHPVTKEKQKSIVRFLVCVLDSPARAIVQNVLHFNGRYGCNMCETKTRLTPHVPDVKRLRVYYYSHNPKLRTKSRMLKQAGRVVVGSHVKGVKGPSVLSIIPSVDISQCIVPEYMHSVLLGVVKQLLVTWTSKVGDWSLKYRIEAIDRFLKNFRHPSFVHRTERQLKNLSYWNASDFYYFLFFESLPALKGHLPEKYLQHLILLIKGIFTLLKTCITQAEIDQAEMLLKLFTLEFGVLYGSRELTSNVHQLIHLGLCVRRFGPLHCFSAFPFEDVNGLIAKRTHGTNLVDTEIVNNIRICQGINILRNIVRGFGSQNDCNNAHSAGEFLGKNSNELLPPEELDLLQDENPIIFSRAKLGYDHFSSEMYKSLKSENFYVMWIENGSSKYALIKYFAQTKADNLVVLRLFKVDQTEVFYHQETLKCIDHIIPVTLTEKVDAVPFSQIVPSIVKVGKIGRFIYKRPNLYRYVM